MLHVRVDLCQFCLFCLDNVHRVRIVEFTTVPGKFAGNLEGEWEFKQITTFLLKLVA